jgi:hypothetical protein
MSFSPRSITGMYGSEFQKCLKQLNPKLRVCCLENSNHAAGVYYIDPVEGYTSVCGVDKGFVPVATEVDAVGHILKSGWYRVVNILLNRKLTTPRQVRKVWPGFFESRIPPAVFSNVDPILSKVKTYVTEAEARKGDQKLSDEQILDVSDDIRKKDSEVQKLERDKAKFDLDKATGKNKIYL